jgi:hypothetical protein
MKKEKIILFLISTFSFAFLLFSTGCGMRIQKDETNSPKLVDFSLTSYNEGSADTQYVKAILTFDKEIKIDNSKLNSLRLTIGGNRVQSEDYQLQVGETSYLVECIVHVESITTGIFTMGISENTSQISAITDSSGQYAVYDFEIEGIIPSGVKLKTVSTSENACTVEVEGTWNIRSIAWLKLTENGIPVSTQEKNPSYLLDSAVAVHGHEFLIEDEADIANSITETLETSFDKTYEFHVDGKQISIQKKDTSEDSEIELSIYTYYKIDGELKENETEIQTQETESSGNTKKQVEENRQMTNSEEEFCRGLHILSGTDNSLYKTLKITGDAIGEEEVYSVKDLEQLVQYSFTNEQLNAQELPKTLEEYQGISLINFLKLCGVSSTEGVYVLGVGNTESIIELNHFTKENILIAFSKNNKALSDKNGPLCLVIKDGNDKTVIKKLTKLLVSTSSQPSEMEYTYHNREPYDESKDKTFTIEVYKKNSEYLGAISSLELTTEQMEQLAKEHPEAVYGNYYGTIGDSESMEYMGIGGWLDYYEGLDLSWIFINQLGIDKNASGSVILYGRDGEEYNRVEDIQYFLQEKNSDDYTVMTADGECIKGAYPIIAYSKNGYPLLPEHDHESIGYVAYNHMSTYLESIGVETEIGVVKNHSGPFVAGLGNCKGFYGGYQVETGGDCVKMKVVIE